MPTITATGRGVVNWGSNHSCITADERAEVNAKSNLRVKAGRVCPGGYRITSGPTFTTLINCVLKFVGLWPDLITVKRATATIECNNSGKLPRFVLVDDRTDQEEMYAAVLAWKEHHDAVVAAYEEIATIKTHKQMERYLRKAGNKDHLNSFLEAVKQGQVDKIVPPDLQVLLIEPPFGGALAEIVDEEGIAAINVFLRDLDKARQSGGCSRQKEPVCGDGSKVVNINVNF